MKKQKGIILILIILFPFHLISQNYYYSPEGREFLDVSMEKVLIKFKDDITFSQQREILRNIEHVLPLEERMLIPHPRLTMAELEGIATPGQLESLLNMLRAIPEVEFANHFLKHKDGTLHGITNQLLVRLKNIQDVVVLNALLKNFPADVEQQNEFDRLLFHIRIKPHSNINALELANLLHETGYFDYAEPDFLRLMKPFNTNDTYVNNQWALNNDGVNTQQWGGISGADMKVFTAWATSTGIASVKVAIIDEGVDLSHPDLQGNLLPGYDATGQGSQGAPQGNDAHGTACAGIVAAVGNNNRGVAGVAYSCKIIPVRIAYGQGSGWVTYNSWIANGINWAWQTAGADILSNSWGGGSSSSTINNAINGAATSGRNGLGCPVLFAAGNDNSSNQYPATLTNVISVIAMSMCNERKNPNSCDGEYWWGSNYGNGADVAAPGVKIYTCDISGSAGYASGDYISDFNGTSSACPNAAGVMALILSVNNSLSYSQARYILESTCDKVGGYNYMSNVSGQPNGTWSTELGYGRINAQAALMLAAPSQPDDAGITSVVYPAGNTCTTSVLPEVTLQNFGSNNLTSVNIHYQVDGGSVNTYQWTGSLASTQSTTVTLPGITTGGGFHTLNAYTTLPNGNTDSNPGNDGASASFYAGNNGLTLTIVLDNYPEETSWEVRDGSNNIIASGGTYGNYPDGSTVVENFCVADGCFDFIIYDAYGDGICCGYGQGSYTLTEDATGNVLANGGAFGSSETTNFCVSSTPPLVVNITATSDVSCYGGQDGSATASASGGTPPYNYLWNNGATTSTVTGLMAGNYTVTVTDGNGTTATATATIGQPPLLTVSVLSADETCYNATDGSVTASVNGGTPPYNYLWSNGATTAQQGGLGSGTYDVTVTDANGCSATSSGVVGSPAPLQVSMATQDVTCNGGSDGSVTLSVTGGTPPYSYTWSNGATTSSLSGVTAGTYSVTVTDAGGCTATAMAQISEPSALALGFSVSDASCANASDGSVDLTVSGGTGSYSYQWSNGSTNEDLIGVSSGNYSVTVTDGNGCSASGSATVGAATDLTVTVSGADVSCHGGSDGSATAVAGGGTPPYNYTWSNGATGSTVSGLPAGTYYLTVSDANGCAVVGAVTINQPTLLTVNVTATDETCYNATDGSVTASVNGGTPPYNYLWSNGATTAQQGGLGSGTYGVTVTDANGCTATGSGVVGSPAPLQVSAAAQDVTCHGGSDGSVTLSVTGGTPPYGYTWSNGATTSSLSGVTAGTYSVTVTDAGGCTATTMAQISEPSALALGFSVSDASCANASDGSVDLTVSGGTGSYSYQWSNGSTNEDLIGVSSGNYSVTVTDGNGCSASGSATVGAATDLTVTVSGADVSCHGGSDGSATAVAGGGTPPYNYTWSNGATGSTISGLPAGTYYVTVSDANGCGVVGAVTLQSPAPLGVTVSTTDESCSGNDGTASVSVSGGTAPYSYLWSTGATVNSLNNLASGTYTVTVTDANNCSASQSGTVQYNCTGCNYVTIDFQDFENGWGIWNDGGSDCALSSNSSYAYSGTYSLQLRDNSGIASSSYTSPLNLYGYDELTISFTYIPVSMDRNNEDFFLEISLDGGSSFSLVEEWNLNDEFVNNTRYFEQVIIPGPFTNNVVIRFRCDASGNSDWVYIDDVKIDGCQSSVEPTCNDGIQNGQETGVDCGGPDCPACPTCSDGIQNGNETGVDCGGPDCPPCSSGCTYQLFNSNDFENGWGIWNDGGSDCRRNSKDAAYAKSGIYCVRLRDNSGLASSMYTDPLDLTGFSEISVNFSYLPVSMDNSNEDFFLEISLDGGNSFTLVEEWNYGDEFVNNVRYDDQVVIAGPFTANTILRFRCDASANNDLVYIDDVEIYGCAPGAGSQNSRLTSAEELPLIQTSREGISPAIKVNKLYPNPADAFLFVDFSSSVKEQVQWYVADITGKVILTGRTFSSEGNNTIGIDIQSLQPGYYFFTLLARGGKIHAGKFVITR